MDLQLKDKVAIVLIKKLLFILAILLFCVKTVGAQKVNHIRIPLVREMEKIDTLLDKFVNLGDPAKSCFVLYADPIGGSYGLNVKGIRTDTAVLNLNFLMTKGEFGYFYYKRFLVLVVNSYDSFHFFDETVHSKSFKYIWDPIKAKDKQRYPAGRYFCSDDFIYPGGKFYHDNLQDSIPEKEIDVQSVTESKKIDSLLDNYVGNGDPRRSCFDISSEMWYGQYRLAVSGVWTDTKLLNMNVFWQNPELGYFRYKGYLVIVELRADPYHLFHKQGAFKKLKFESNERKSENKETNPMGWAFGFNNYYMGEHGKFQRRLDYNSPPTKIVKTIDLQVVKEDKKIDSLLDHYNIPGGATDTCIIIYSGGTKSYSDLQIEKIRTDTTLIKLHLRALSDLKVFNYKGNIVFVKKYGDPYNFFPETSQTKKIRFELFDPDPDISPQFNLGVWMFDYKDGEFKIPPSLIQTN